MAVFLALCCLAVSLTCWWNVGRVAAGWPVQALFLVLAGGLFFVGGVLSVAAVVLPGL